jgi:hypothetical protein
LLSREVLHRAIASAQFMNMFIFVSAAPPVKRHETLDNLRPMS